MKTKTGLFWHVHHEVLCEYSHDIDERIEYIKKNKPAHEVDLRLRLMQPVKGKLPDELVKANKARVKANKAWVKAYEARDKAYEAWVKANKAWVKARVKEDKAWDKYKDEIEALHKEECKDCPWNGKTIFPEAMK